METKEEKERRNENITRMELQRIKHGGVSHNACVVRSIGIPDMQKTIDPVVMLANDDDGFYVQVFRSRNELEAFVTHLLETANEAWPNATLTSPPFDGL